MSSSSFGIASNHSKEDVRHLKDHNDDALDRSIPEELQCPICQELFYLPTTIFECQHTFCSLCIRQCFLNQTKQVSVKHRSSKRYCPICRSSVNDTTSECTKSLHFNATLQNKLNAWQRKEGEERYQQQQRMSSYDSNYQNTSRQPQGPLRPIKLPIQLDHKKSTELRALCRQHLLNTHGTDSELRDRLRLFAMFWNAHCSSNLTASSNGPWGFDPREIRRKFQQREQEKVLAARRDVQLGMAQHKSYVHALLEQQQQTSNTANATTTTAAKSRSSITTSKGSSSSSSNATTPSQQRCDGSPTLDVKWKNGFDTLIAMGLEQSGTTAQALRNKHASLRRKWVDQYGACEDRPSKEDGNVQDDSNDGRRDSSDPPNDAPNAHERAPATAKMNVGAEGASMLVPPHPTRIKNPYAAKASLPKAHGNTPTMPSHPPPSGETCSPVALPPSTTPSSSLVPPLSSSPPITATSRPESSSPWKKRKDPPAHDDENEPIKFKTSAVTVRSEPVVTTTTSPREEEYHRNVPIPTTPTTSSSDPLVVRDGNSAASCGTSVASASSTAASAAPIGGTAPTVALTKQQQLAAIQNQESMDYAALVRLKVVKEYHKLSDQHQRTNFSIIGNRRTSSSSTNSSGVWDCPQCTYRNKQNTSSHAWCQMCCLKRHSPEYYQKLQQMEAEKAHAAAQEALTELPRHPTQEKAPSRPCAAANGVKDTCIDLTEE